MFKKFKTMVLSWFNYGIDQLSDTIKIAEYKILQNKKAIEETAELAADTFAEGEMLNKKIHKLKIDITKGQSDVQYAITKDDPITGKKALAGLKIRETYLHTLTTQRDKLKDQRIKLENIIEKVKLKNDMLTTELHINKTKAKGNSNVKNVLKTLSELTNVETGGIIEDLEKEGISNEYQVDKYLKVLDTPDLDLDKEWESYKTK